MLSLRNFKVPFTLFSFLAYLFSSLLMVSAGFAPMVDAYADVTVAMIDDDEEDDRPNDDEENEDDGREDDSRDDEDDRNDDRDERDDDSRDDRDGKKKKKKRPLELSDDLLKEVDGVTCGYVDDNWVPGILLGSGKFLPFLFKSQNAKKKGNRKVAKKMRRRHKQNLETCQGEGGSDGGGDGGSGGGNIPPADGQYIVFDSNATFSFGRSLFSTAYRLFDKDGRLLGSIAIGNGNSQSKALHAAHVFHEYLDNDEDGTCDNQLVCDALVASAGAVIIVTEQQLESMGEPGNSPLQPLFPNEINTTSAALLGGSAETFDFTLEEVLHFLTDNGWSKAYASQFGINGSSQWGQLVSSSISAGFYDPTASGDTKVGDFSTTVPESLYWTITSLFGAQDFPWRLSAITAEWKSYNSTLLGQNVPGMKALIEDPQYKFPRNRPNGSYAPAAG